MILTLLIVAVLASVGTPVTIYRLYPAATAPPR